jgi:hypothetical protein
VCSHKQPFLGYVDSGPIRESKAPQIALWFLCRATASDNGVVEAVPIWRDPEAYAREDDLLGTHHKKQREVCSVMDNCAFCNTETEHYANSVPICGKCSADRAHKSAPTEAEIRDALQAELSVATVQALEANDKLKAITQDIPTGLPSPDGTPRIKNALHEVTASRIEMMKVHKRMIDFIQHGTVPEDLKRSD